MMKTMNNNITSLLNCHSIKLYLFKFQTPTAVNKVKDLVNSQQECVSLGLKCWHQVR